MLDTLRFPQHYSMPLFLLMFFFFSNSSMAQSKFLSQLVPDLVNPGETFKVVIQFKNTSTQTWNSSSSYTLKAISPLSKKVWGKQQISFPQSAHVPPGETASFVFTLTAPQQSGAYDFNWRMHHRSQGGFGESNPSTQIQVGRRAAVFSDDYDSEFIAQSIDQVMMVNENYEVSVIYKNTGNTIWTARNVFLMSRNPPNNLTWLVDRIDFSEKEQTQPGSFKTFKFIIRAPSEADAYDFQWKMSRKNRDSFGEKTDNKSIIVHTQDTL
ncbi:hypothetical protein MNBD_GAMMA16-819 [hydrothermal vent metagenome]|uniref:Nbr1 FW domain-containing protein n=1 Tax=hydrothermal vent metagenome TaxID=652676 RepID=A0A3B0ZF09_9ZZZZ